ncbi:MAG: phosphotransferase [Acidobacteria bacterium]|nr:phosphotransferase [Acidobacteriota bacterium]
MEDGATRAMAETLQEGLSQLRGRALRIVELVRHPLEKPSSFHCERLRVLLGGGEQLPVFFKDLNPQNQSEETRRIRRADISLSRRELLMYRSVFARERFGTPQLYAFRWEPSRAILWLFLEDAGLLTLNNSGDFTHWVETAKWAARFHAAVRHFPTSRIGFLPQFDRSHYWDCVKRVQSKLPELSSDDRAFVYQSLEDYIPLIEWLSGLPRTLIHGEMFPSNIVLRAGAHERLIAAVDWESAAIGPHMLDVVSLTSGMWNVEQRRILWRNYFDQYQLATGVELDWDAFTRELGGIALYHALSWIARWPGRNFAPQLQGWIAELKSVMKYYFLAG